LTIYLQSNCTPESAELFVNCLEAMVEICMKVQEPNKETAIGKGKRQSDSALKPRPSTVGLIQEHYRMSSEIDSSVHVE